jgi:hypothetical protein
MNTTIFLGSLVGLLLLWGVLDYLHSRWKVEQAKKLRAELDAEMARLQGELDAARAPDPARGDSQDV